MPFSLFNNPENKMRLDREYNTQASRLNGLLNIAHWYMTNHQLCEADVFSYDYNRVSQQHAGWKYFTRFRDVSLF